MKSFIAKLKSLLNFPLKWEELTQTRPVPGLGYLHWIGLLSAIGMIFISFSNIQGRNGSEQAMQLYWLGLACIIIPPTIRFVSFNVSSNEAVGMLLIFAVVNYSIVFMSSPLVFKGFDEALHWRTAADILYNGHLFTPNSMLPVSPLYPGLENATTALVNLSGLSIFEAASVLLVGARIILVLSLYFLFLELSGSVRTAGIAALIYTGSSTFTYFDAQFGYESLALPLVLLCLFMLLRRTRMSGVTTWIWNILLALIMFSIVATHHMTTYALTGILILWVCVDIITVLAKGQSSSPFWATFLMVALIWLWVGVISTNTISYLTPILNGSVSSFYTLLSGQSPPRQLFQDSSGQSSALLFERVVGILAVLVSALSLPFGAWQWWLRYKKQALATTLLVIAAIFPLLPIMRLSSGAWDLANRASGFVFMGLGFIGALGMIQFPLPPNLIRIRQIIVVLGVSIIYVGGVIAGVSPGSRLDQPYRPATGPRSIDNQSVLTGDWARRVLGPNYHMASDRTMTQVMGSYGMQRMITDLSDKISVSGIFLRFELTPSEIGVISKMAIRYLVIDDRLTTVIPTYGYYFEAWEQTIVSYIPPVSLPVLEKFDHMPSVSRIYDSGDIVIYDVGALISGQP